MGAKGRVEMMATRASLGLGTGAPEVLGPGMRPGSLLPMQVKELKAVLAARGLSSDGCIEKQDFVNHILLAQPGGGE